jgi:hypothetical protein
VALCCVMFTIFRARLDRRRERIRTDLMSLEHQQQSLEEKIEYEFPLNPKTTSELKQVNAQIAEKQRQIGDTRNFTKEWHRKNIRSQIEGSQKSKDLWVAKLDSEPDKDRKMGLQGTIDLIDARISNLRVQYSELDH